MWIVACWLHSIACIRNAFNFAYERRLTENVSVRTIAAPWATYFDEQTRKSEKLQQMVTGRLRLGGKLGEEPSNQMCAALRNRVREILFRIYGCSRFGMLCAVRMINTKSKKIEGKIHNFTANQIDTPITINQMISDEFAFDCLCCAIVLSSSDNKRIQTQTRAQQENQPKQRGRWICKPYARR